MVFLDGSRDAIQSTTDTVTFQGQTLVVPKYDESIILQTTQYLKDLQDGTLQFGEYGKHVREVASNTQEYFEFLKDVGNDASDPLTNKAMDVLIKATEFGQNTVVKSFSTTVHETKLYEFKESIQQMGYKINSPYKDRPFIDIDSNRIDMDNLAYDQLKLIGDNGVEIIANNNSGIIIVPGATKVREIPIKMTKKRKRIF